MDDQTQPTFSPLVSVVEKWLNTKPSGYNLLEITPKGKKVTIYKQGSPHWRILVDELLKLATDEEKEEVESLTEIKLKVALLTLGYREHLALRTTEAQVWRERTS